MKDNITLLNILSSLLMQLVSIVSAMIVPRLILETFGSNTYGLVSSISQFLNYICLVEGGITGVISANIYKPLVDGDNDKLSTIIVTAKKFYKNIGLIFVVYSLIVGLFYPFIVETNYAYFYVVLLTVVLSFGLMLDYMFSLTLTTLLNADKKVYIVAFTSSVLTIANVILTLVVIKIFPDIIILKFVNASLFALKPLIFGLYIRNNYKINWKAQKDTSLIGQRWNGFAINLAFFVHSSTDIAVLTLFSDLKTVSVYSIYLLIVSKVSFLLHAVTSGFEPTIGQAYALNDEKDLNKKMDLYEFVVLMAVGFLFLITGLLITPFVMVYTKGITDADYYQPLFGVILVVAEAIYLLRSPHVSLAYTANKFKEITIPAYIEAAINIIVSIVLIIKVGLVGVAIGTLVGMLYRGAFHVWFTSKLIPKRKQSTFYKKLLVVLTACILSSSICIILFPFSDYSIKTWMQHAFIYSLICGSLLLSTGYFCFKKEFTILCNYIKKRKD